jgi:hypothetical protein
MATGTTLTISTRADKAMQASVAATDAGAPTAATVEVIYLDTATQTEILKCLEDAKHYVIQNVAKP